MISIDKLSRKPIYEQIIDCIEREIITGELSGGMHIPSVRELSSQLAINPNTIQKAYTELDRRGVICTVPARGAFVADNALNMICNSRLSELDGIKREISELKLAGVDRKVLLDMINEIYGGGDVNDKNS